MHNYNSFCIALPCLHPNVPAKLHADVEREREREQRLVITS